MTQKLNAIANDLKFLFDHKEFYLWYTDFYTHAALNKIQGVIQQQLANYELPESKIAAVDINGKRMFTLKPVNPMEYSKSKLKKEREKIFKKGLKPNERKIIWNYIEKKGFSFPLEKGKLYKWMDVKSLLQNVK